MKKRKFFFVVTVTVIIFVAALNTREIVAQYGGGSATPGARCTTLQWPQLSAKQIRSHKTKKVKPGGPGTRCGRMFAKHTAEYFPNHAPVINQLRPQYTLGPEDQLWIVPEGGKMTFSGIGRDPDDDTMLYTWSATTGRITGDDGPVRDWDLSGAAPGVYTISVEVDDGCGCVSFKSANARVGPDTGDTLAATSWSGGTYAFRFLNGGKVEAYVDGGWLKGTYKQGGKYVEMAFPFDGRVSAVFNGGAMTVQVAADGTTVIVNRSY